MLHRLCGPPSIPLSFTLQAVHLMRLLRYQYFYCHLVYIVYCADYQGI